MAEVVVPVVETIVGWVIEDTIKKLIGYIVGDDGELKPVKFTDENGDGVPDNPEEPLLPWSPTDIFPDYEPNKVTTYIIVNPDGTMTIYDESGNITAENCDMAYSLWLSDNGIMSKKMNNYSVTEGLLFLILLLTAFNFVRGLFRRKDVFR